VRDKLRVAAGQDAMLNVFKQKMKPKRKDEATGQFNVENLEVSWVGSKLPFAFQSFER